MRIILTAAGLRRLLRRYVGYERSLIHLGLDKETPVSRPRSTAGRILTIPHGVGLHHRYERIASLRVSPRLRRETSRQICPALIPSSVGLQPHGPHEKCEHF
jgi:hypothetical protein